MKRILVLIGVLLLAIGAVAYLYFSSLRNTSAGYPQIVEAIPADAVFAYSFTNEKEYDDIFKQNHVFASVAGKPAMDEFRQIKNLINQKNGLKQVFNGQTVFMSLHADTLKQQLNWLMITAVPKLLSWNRLNETIGKNGTLKELQVNGQSIQVLTAKGFKRPLYFVRHKSLMAVSFSAELISHFVGNTGETPFTQLADQQNRNALAGLLVNYRMLPHLAAIINRNRTDRLFSMLPAISGSSATTLTYNKSALLFNGFTRIENNAGNFAALLSGQKPVKLNIDRILPNETAAYTAIGISNYRLFATKLDSAYKHNGFKTRKNNLQKQLNFSLPDLIRQQFTDEYALALLPNTEKMAFVKIKNGLKLKQYLISMAEDGNDNEISRFRYDNFPEAYFGSIFHDLKRPYFAVAGEYLVMANSYQALNNYLRDRQNNHLLGNDDDYNSHKKLMADQGNINWFVFLKNAKNVLRQQLKPEVYDLVSADNIPGLGDLDGFSLQLSVNGSEFYTNICLKTGNIEDFKAEPVWQYRLGARLYGKPRVLTGPDGKHIVILEDASNQLHVLTDNGKIIWQKQLNGRILGDIQIIKHHFLLNTSAKIYMLDANGNDAEGFPLSLPANATAAVTVFNNSIIVPLENRLAGYSMDGSVQPSWQNTVSGNIRFSLKEADFGHKKYLSALTENGYVYLFATDGAELKKYDMNASSAFPFSYALRMAADEDNSCLISATTNGEVYRMYLNGHTEHENIGVFTGKITFNCANILGDEKPEMIFLDARQLTVYTSSNTQAYNYLFNKSVKASVQVIDGGNEKRIGIRAGNELFLFNDDGTLMPGFPFKGNAAFWAGDLYGDGQKFIVTGEGLNAKAYALQ